MPTNATNKKSPAKTAIKKSLSETATRQKSAARELMVKVRSRGRADMAKRAEQKLAELEQQQAGRDAVLRQWLQDLNNIGVKLKASLTAYRQEVRNALKSLYIKYLEIEASELRNDFYNELRAHLLAKGCPVQVNTPDAGLLVRLVWAEDLSNARIHNYAQTVSNARSLGVEPDDFLGWVKRTTIAGAAKKLDQADAEERKKDRLRRARILLLTYLDWRETHPKLYGQVPMLANSVNELVNPKTQLVVMIGTAVRRFDRESDYADIYVSHIMPPNLDIELKILDRWAGDIALHIDQHEAEFKQMPLEQWADLMEDKLWAIDVADAEKQSVKWALRQQAASFEDQKEFAKHARAFKKARSNTGKSDKSNKANKGTKK